MGELTCVNLKTGYIRPECLTEITTSSTMSVLKQFKTFFYQNIAIATVTIVLVLQVVMVLTVMHLKNKPEQWSRTSLDDVDSYNQSFLCPRISGPGSSGGLDRFNDINIGRTVDVILIVG